MAITQTCSPVVLRVKSSNSVLPSFVVCDDEYYAISQHPYDPKRGYFGNVYLTHMTKNGTEPLTNVLNVVSGETIIVYYPEFYNKKNYHIKSQTLLIK